MPNLRKLMYKTNKQHGFTIIELMISVTLLALLLTFAVPSFMSTIERNKLSSQTNILIGALHLTRSESVKRGKTVTLCKSTDGVSCSTDSSVGYDSGWMIFVEQPGNPIGTRNAGADESIIKVQSALGDEFSLRGPGTYDDFIAYVPTGAVSTATATAAGYLVLCLENDITKGKAVMLDVTGRAYSAKDTDHNGAPEDDSGANLTTCTP